MATAANGANPRLVAARGELDVYGAAAFRSAIVAGLQAGASVVADLVEVEFIDSAALGALVGAARRARPGTRVVAACANPGVVRVFEATGTDRVVPVYPTVEDALGAVTRG
jgi:anti-sigma B factor antagonist